KLVPQDPNDEPASVLLDRVEEEKRRLYNEGKIRKLEKLPPVGPDEVPFEVPQGWVWARLGDVALIEMGNSPPGTSYNTTGEGVPLINGPSEFSPDPLGYALLSQYTTEPTKLCRPGDLLICVRGATTGRTNIAAFEACIGRGVGLIRAGDLQPYVNRYVVSRRADILAMGSGSTFPCISYRHLAELLIPIPPRPEQHRIVAKVDELMALCDELEERQRRRAEKRVSLNRSALHHLATATDDADLARHWRRIRDHFDVLYEVPETVAELRQAILQLAVRGKLVPQDPNDEPASVLLERIKEEKRRLYNEGKIRKLEKLPPVEPDEVPFEVPEGWVWVRMGQLITLISGQHLPPGEYHHNSDGIPYLTGPADFGKISPVATRSTHTRKAVAERGDILLTVKG